MIDSTKKAFYASVGAPVVTAKRINEKFQEITAKMRETDLSAEFDAWATEAEKLIDRFNDQPVIEEWGAKLDDIDVPAQVSKLREPLDDMVENWRKNFRPEGPVTVPVEDEPVKKTVETKKAAPKTATAKKPAASKTAKKA